MEETTSSTALTTLSEDEQALLAKDRQKSGSALPTLPLIRLVNKDMEQGKEGSYFVETRKGKDENPDIRDIGPNPEIVILYKTSTYSYFTPEDGLIAWSSDIHGFTSLDHVTLFRKKNGEVQIDFDGVWPDFRNHMNAKYCFIDPATERTKKLLKFKSVLYVLFEGKPHKMFVSNASAVGVDAEGRPSFDAPQELSLQHFENQCWNSKHATYEYRIELGSRLVKSTKPFYLMTFNLLGQNENLKEALHARHATEKAILAIDDARRNSVAGSALKEETNQSFGNDPSPVLPDTVSVEDLPF